MDSICNKIIATDKLISDTIANKSAMSDKNFDRTILKLLETLIEDIALLIYHHDNKSIVQHVEMASVFRYINTKDNLHFLTCFYQKLQADLLSVHVDDTSFDFESNYYAYYLSLCKVLLKNKFNVDILNDIHALHHRKVQAHQEYYKKIWTQLDKIELVEITESPTRRCYIHKKKTIQVDDEIFYELTLSDVFSKTGKFDHFIAFTKIDIPTYYAVHLRFEDIKIKILNKSMPIKVITGFRVSVRPCEFNNFFKILDHETKVGTFHNEYKALMTYLTQTGRNLCELVEMDEHDYAEVRDTICKGIKTTPIFDGLDKCRTYQGKPGYNVLVYLLYHLRKTVIRHQSYYADEICLPNRLLSDLRLLNGCIPFDTRPFAANPIKHIPNHRDLCNCFNYKKRTCELLARVIKQNTEIRGKLYTPIEELSDFGNVDELISQYNDTLHPSHTDKSSLINDDGFVYINGYETNTIKIIRRLQELANTGVDNYSQDFEKWMEQSNYIIDSAEKYQVMQTLFASSKVALIYGSAGSGKSTMIKHISKLFAEEEKIYLANTHTAKGNLERYVGDTENTTFSTIKSHISQGRTYCDILFIDECSAVSNEHMAKILENTSFKLLVLVGDVYQIESINFGNWFAIAKYFVQPHAISELTYVHRSSDTNLKSLFESVRELDGKIDGKMAKLLDQYSVEMDESIFDVPTDDEIVLCLNYDGLYGINNINRFLQDNNYSKSVQLDMETYKVNDKIIFNDNERFGHYLYNNLKGKITDIQENDSFVKFFVEVDISFDEDEYYPNFVVEKLLENNKSIVSFTVNKFSNPDDSEKELDAIVPFQIAYAVSIHKAQGLEYDSVKIVITDEMDEVITHNIFYTAITRAKKRLKIYWSKDARLKILSKMKPMFNRQDATILAEKYALTLNNRL